MLWSFLSVLGCAPLGPFSDPSGGESPGPDGILVDPAVIDFGVFTFPEKPDDPQFLTSTFSVYNAGLESTYLQGQGDVIGSNAFTVQGAPGPDTLAGHEVVEYTVVFQPRVDDVYEGEISLNLGDAVVEIYGEAHAPRLEVEDSIQISTPYRCEQVHALRVQNIGHDLLTLDPNDFSAAGPQYGLSWTSDKQLVLEPGGVTELGITFAPTDDEIGVWHDNIEARIGTNEPGDPIRTIAITAKASDEGDTVESFRFDTDLQSSLLIVPDTRAAMASTLDAFASAADSLVAAIANKNDNGVQVAVVGGFDGQPCPTTERPFYDTRVDKLPDIAAAIAEGLTDAGASTGNLLDLMQGAVYEMADKHCLDGFLRPGTSLHVLLLSNGTEDSFNDPSTYAQSILNQVTGPLSGTGAEISVFVPGAQDCSDEGCTRLIEAADYLSGSVWDLSTGNWNDTLASYGVSLVPPDGDLPLLLSQRAHVSSKNIADDIVLTAEGQSGSIDPQYYSYDPGLAAVMLKMSAPIPAGAVVQVSYLPDAVCD